MSDLHKQILEQAINAYAYHRIITDETGEPVDYVYLEVNKAFLQILGLKKSQILNRRVTEIIPDIKKDPFNWIRFFGDVALTQKPKRTVQYSEVIGKWFKISAFCPEPGFFVAIFDDITEEMDLASEQRKLLAEVSSQEQKFRTLIDHSPDALLLLNRQCFVDCNEAAVRLFEGVKKEDIVGMSPVGLSPEYQPDGSLSSDRARKIIRDVYAGIDQRFEWQHKRINGTPFYAEVILTLIPYGEDSIIYTVIRDISDRYLTKAELYRTNNLLETIMFNSPDMIWIRDLNFNLTYINQAVERMKGFTREEALLRKLSDNVTAETYQMMEATLKEELSFEFNPAISKNRIRRFESDEICKDGSLIHTETIASFFRDAEGRPQGIVGITRDITDQQKIYEELEKAKARAEESDRLKTSFLANMSHEIRTPMNSIIGFAELLGDEDTEAIQRKKYVEIIQNSSEHLLNLISEIIDVSKIEAGQLSLRTVPVDLNEWLQTVQQEMSGVRNAMGKTNITLDICQFPHLNPPVVRVDPGRLRQVLTNLIHNALKFTESGGIEIRCTNLQSSQLRFSIKDSGPGISPEHIGIIFQRFRQGEENLTRKHGGTGLGLAICKGLIELMGGEIGVNSKPGEGSEFWFTIPYQPV